MHTFYSLGGNTILGGGLGSLVVCIFFTHICYYFLLLPFRLKTGSRSAYFCSRNRLRHNTDFVGSSMPFVAELRARTGRTDTTRRTGDACNVAYETAA